jgi:Methyltransferase domain
MATVLEEALSEAVALIAETRNLVRVVLSGRRRNMQTPTERIDIRPVLIKERLHLQVIENDGRQTTAKNFLPVQLDVLSLLNCGYANILVEQTTGSLSIRISKKGEALITRSQGSNEQVLSHDKTKNRLLKSADPFLVEVGISDAKGIIKPSKSDKYMQVEEFLRILAPTLGNAIEAGQLHKPTSANPLTITDLGCGHAYLTFGAHQYLQAHNIPVKVVGIDIRTKSRDRNSAIAQKLGIKKSIEFRAEEISETTISATDIAIALHACDTATDDAIAWAVQSEAKLLFIAPCCHHDLQSQLSEIPEPWSLLTKHGLMKERISDLLTDALRAQILRLLGYRVDVIEFIGGEHTPRNLMIRAVKTGAKADAHDRAKYEEMIVMWKVKPALAERLEKELVSSATA